MAILWTTSTKIELKVAYSLLVRILEYVLGRVVDGQIIEPVQFGIDNDTVDFR